MKYSGTFALISHILFILETFQISLGIKKTLKFNLVYIFKVKFDRVHEKILADAHLKIIQTNYVHKTEIVTQRFNEKFSSFLV